MAKGSVNIQKIKDEFLEGLNNATTRGVVIQSLIQDLTPLGTVMTYAPQSHIIKKGDINESIFFLQEGSVEIVIDHEIIATLSKQGEVVGEMSIVSKRKSSADVIAKNKVVMLKVLIADLKKEFQEHELLLYKIFCVTLSEKLENTNIKAKNFEILRRSLENEIEKRTADLTLKHSELTLGYKKLESMHEENMLMIKKLSHLDEQYLKPSLKLIEHFHDKDDSIDLVKTNLKLIQTSLSSLQSLKAAQDKLQGQKVLVIESNPKQRNMIKMALGGTGVHADLAKTVEESEKMLSENQFDIIFLSADMLEILDFLQSKKIQTKVVLFTEEGSKDYLAKIRNYKTLSNIIARKEDDRAFNIKSISTTVSKMTTGDIFGLEKYLNWGIEVKQFEICDSRERAAINEKVVAQLEEYGIRSTVRSQCQIVIEELLMNAIYDAPVDTNGSPLHNKKKRTEDVLLSPEQGAKLRFSSDGLFLAISVEDPFGEFNKEIIFKYLENNYYDQNKDYNQQQGKGGAGKGLFMITENSDLVIYNIAPKMKTEVIALFDLDPNKEKRTTSLHYFEL